ncbi:MAG: hypothetical protein ACI4XE_10420 [Acutalibacteraceae bacterium]
MKRFRRIVAGILVLCLVCSFAFAVGFANHPGHQCHEKNCMICNQLKAAGELLDRVSRLVVIGFLFSCLAVFGRTVILLCSEKQKNQYETPVSLKVKILS